MPFSIPNSISTSDLHVAELIDPTRVKFFAQNMADQINNFRMKYSPQKRCIDLSEWIADVIIETSAQGASLLEVHIIDPAWALLMRDPKGVSFIDVDDTGFIWPPVEVTFPPNISDSTWRLCQVKPSTDLTAPNLVLTFEDKIVSELREHDATGPNGIAASNPNETRAEFIQRLIKNASDHPAYPTDGKIRFKPLLPPSTFTTADLSMSQTTPTSANNSNSPARKNPNKKPATTKSNKDTTQGFLSGVDITIQSALNALGGVAKAHGGIGEIPGGPPVSSVNQFLGAPF